MEHWKNSFDYKYTGAYELQPNEEKVVTIKKVCKEEVNSTDGKKSMCLVAYFEESSKPMVLNKTNCKTIEKLYSPFTDDWLGKKITVFAQKVKAFGDTVDALRIRPTKPIEKAVDYSAQIKLINDCKTLEELKTVWTSEGFPTVALETIKNKKKDELSKN